MIVTAEHPLVLSRDYRKLSVREGGEMAFELRPKPAVFLFSEPVMDENEVRRFFAVSRGGLGHEWLRLEARRGIIRPFYRWNGNSIKKVVAGVRVGTPDFAGGWMGSTIEKSLFHDALFQFSPLEELTEIFDLEKSNEAYRTIEGERPFRLNGIYCAALDRWSADTWGELSDDDASVSCIITTKDMLPRL